MGITGAYIRDQPSYILIRRVCMYVRKVIKFNGVLKMFAKHGLFL